MVRVGFHATINGKMTSELGSIELDHPELAGRDVAAALRALADEFDVDGQFYGLAARSLFEGEPDSGA